MSYNWGPLFIVPTEVSQVYSGTILLREDLQGIAGQATGETEHQGRGQRARILGRVCMQLTAVDMTDIPGVAPGDLAVLLGADGENAINPEALSSWWGTIPYEVFCLLGMNPREYVATTETAQGENHHDR